MAVDARICEIFQYVTGNKTQCDSVMLHLEFALFTIHADSRCNVCHAHHLSSACGHANIC